ncbi:hypothetical protein BH09CHL1_BH09CHL1_06020 [soil metagenome]
MVAPVNSAIQDERTPLDDAGTHAAPKWRGDAIALAVITLLVVVSTAYLWYFDSWLARIDLMQQLVPFYGFLGEQLRNFNIPGWNPHQLSGQPFAADPLSGWTQWPVMVFFTILPAATAMKVLVGFNLLLASSAAYTLARVLGMNIPAAMTGGVAFGLGSVSMQFNSYCCNIMGNFAPWVPVSLIGIELAMRRKRPIERVAAVALTGIGLSQMLASFVGQGSYYAVLLVAFYGLYRTMISPPGGGWTLKRRALNLLGVGLGIALSGFSLAAAGMLPRLDVSRDSTLKGGRYELIDGPGDRGWRLWQLLYNSLNSEFVARRVYVGTAVVALAIIAPVLARWRFSVPFFFVFSVVCAILVLFPTVVHEPFYLLPRFRELHQHSSYRIFGLGIIGPAMLAAASVDRLSSIHVKPKLWWLIALPLPPIFYWEVREYLGEKRHWLPQQVWIALLLTLALVGTLVILRAIPDLFPRLDRRLKRLAGIGVATVPWLFVLLVFADSTGKDMSDAFRGGSSSPYLNQVIKSRESSNHLIDIYTECQDVGGAGEFLRNQQSSDPQAPFRYFGFDSANLRTEDVDGTSYHGEQGEPQVQALLVATRATCLNLYDLQGYSPFELQLYSDFINAINGELLEYHDAWIMPDGISSPLLGLLNPLYVITPYVIPADRPDLLYVAANMTEVFQNGTIRVFQNPAALPHAWIVHNGLQLPKDQILGTLNSEQVDPAQTVLLEDTPPAMSPSTGEAEPITFSSYKPDEMTMQVTANANGMIVLSEIYSKGWNAYVDGKEVDIYAADYALRGIPITAGVHTVELKYELRSLTAGVIISTFAGIALLGIAAALLWDIRSRRRRTPASPPLTSATL